MTWSDLPGPERGASSAVGPAVTCSLGPSAGRHAAWKLVLVFRPRLLGDLLWLKKGAGIRVMQGSGEHVGMLRITPGTQRLLNGQAAGTTKALLPFPCLRLPAPVGIDLVKRTRFPLEHSYGDDWIEVTLPDWAREKALEVAAAPPRHAPTPPVPAKRPGFQSIASQTPDPIVGKRLDYARVSGA